MFSSFKLNLFYSRRELEKIPLLYSYVLVKKKEIQNVLAVQWKSISMNIFKNKKRK